MGDGRAERREGGAGGVPWIRSLAATEIPHGDTGMNDYTYATAHAILMGAGNGR